MNENENMMNEVVNEAAEIENVVNYGVYGTKFGKGILIGGAIAAIAFLGYGYFKKKKAKDKVASVEIEDSETIDIEDIREVEDEEE